MQSTMDNQRLILLLVFFFSCMMLWDAWQRKDLPPPERPIPLGSRDVYYVFDGEYWNDELHDYRFRIETRCFGEDLVQ